MALCDVPLDDRLPDKIRRPVDKIRRRPVQRASGHIALPEPRQLPL